MLETKATAKLAAQLSALRWGQGPDRTVGIDRVAEDTVALRLAANKVWELSRDYKTELDPSYLLDSLVLEANVILRNYSWDRALPLHAHTIENPDKTLELLITDHNSFTMEIL